MQGQNNIGVFKIETHRRHPNMHKRYDVELLGLEIMTIMILVSIKQRTITRTQMVQIFNYN